MTTEDTAKLEEMVMTKMTASDGLAPVRCEGLLESLLTPCPAAPGACPAHTAAAAKGSFAAAGEALRVRGGARQGRVRACGGRHTRAKENCRGRRGAAPRARN
eukprot:SAG11_NODE_18949_length_477_cov_1.404762_1_plen_102_part_01